MAKKSNLEYAARYYTEHREEILKKRKSRYQDNEAYRTAVKDRANVRSRNLIEANRQFRLENPPKPKKKKVLKQYEHASGGTTRVAKRRRLHRIGHKGLFYDVEMVVVKQMAEILCCTVQTLVKWEAAGTIPVAMYRGEKRARLYTDLQCRLLKNALAKVKRESPTMWAVSLARTSFPRLAERIWVKYPQGVDFTKMEPV